MKYLNILLALIFTLGIATSCEDDMDPKVPADAVKPVLEAPASGQTYVLTKIQEEDILTSVVFSEADFKLDVVTEYTIEVDDAGGDFEYKRVVARGESSPITLKVGTFNKSLLGLGYVGGEAHDIQLRVVAGNYLASEPITMNVTTYFDAEPWSVIGSAVGGWDTSNDKYMSYDKASDTYSITLDMVPGDFKFRAPKKDENGDPWKYNFGLTGDSEIVDNGDNIPLKDGGANMKCSGGNYTITLDVTNQKFSIVQNSAGEFTNWTDVVLDAVGTGVSADNANATADGSSWGWGNVLLPDNEGKPSVDGSKYTWTWTGIVLEADEGFKLRTLNGEASSVNGMQFDVGFGVIDAANSTDKIADAGGNMSVTAKGEYLITLVIDAAAGDAKTVTIEEYVKYPTSLYVNGSFVPNWDWNDPAILEMIPVHSNPHLFWKIAWFEAGTEIKYSPEKAWSGDFGVTGTADADGVYAKGGSNIVIADAGYKMLVVNLFTETVQVTAPKVYAMGAAFGGWNASTYAFTADGSDPKVLISPAAVANDNARMHVAATTLTNEAGGAVDWWQAEFNVFSGAIEYRGIGGDQAAAPITTGQVVKLNFSTESGSFE